MSRLSPPLRNGGPEPLTWNFNMIKFWVQTIREYVGKRKGKHWKRYHYFNKSCSGVIWKTCMRSWVHDPVLGRWGRSQCCRIQYPRQMHVSSTRRCWSLTAFSITCGSLALSLSPLNFLEKREIMIHTYRLQSHRYLLTRGKRDYDHVNTEVTKTEVTKLNSHIEKHEVD